MKVLDLSFKVSRKFRVWDVNVARILFEIGRWRSFPKKVDRGI